MKMVRFSAQSNYLIQFDSYFGVENWSRNVEVEIDS